MNEAEKVQIDEFLADMAEGSLDEAKLQSFEALLLGRNDLQDHYAQRLGHQLLLFDQLKYYQPEFDGIDGQFDPSSTPLIPGLTDDCMPPEDLELSQRPPTAIAERSKPNYDWRYVLGLACSFLLGAVISIWFPRGQQQVAGWTPPATQQPNEEEPTSPTDDSPPLEVTKDGLLVRSERSLNLVSHITGTDSIDGLVLPCESDLTGSVHTPCTGTALLQRDGDPAEKGYLIALDPGQQMDVYVDTTAHDQNALSMVELDEWGELAGGWTTYDNLIDKNVDLPIRRVGKIGYFSQYNPSDKIKYFLFVGSHMRPGHSITKQWHQSDFRVRLTTDNITVVGWDDSGVAKYDGPVAVDYEPDYDFNDVMMTVHYTSPEAPYEATEDGKITYLPAPQEDVVFAAVVGHGCELPVPPNHELVLSAACNSPFMNSVRIVELPSKRVLWSKSNEPEEPGAKAEGDFGVYAIRNDSDDTVFYEVQSFHRAEGTLDGGHGVWLKSPFKAFVGRDQHLVFGFEDHPNDPIHHNNSDVNVIARILKLD